MADWYYTGDGEQHGPVSADTLKQLAANGKLKPTDMVWREGFPQWVAASKTKLFAKPGAIAPPRPPEAHAHAPAMVAAPMPAAAPDPLPLSEPANPDLPPSVYPTSFAAPTMPSAPAPVAAVPLDYHRVQLVEGQMISSTVVMWLGILAILAFLWPVMQPEFSATGRAGRFGSMSLSDPNWKFVLPNIAGLSEPGDIVAKILMVYPLLGGIGLILLAVLAKGTARATGVLVAAAIPVLLAAVALLGSDEVRMLRAIPGPAVSVAIFLLAGTLGWAGLLVGSWVFRYRPGATIGAVIAAIGGGLYILAWLIPFGGRELPGAGVPLIGVFIGLFGEGAPLLVRLLLFMVAAQMVIMIIAAVFSFILAGNRALGEPRAQSIFRMAASSAGIGTFCLAFAMVASMVDSRTPIHAAFFAVIKVLLYVPCFLPLPFVVGLADLLVAVTPATEDPRSVRSRPGLPGLY
jgi:hypothetical protein